MKLIAIAVITFPLLAHAYTKYELALQYLNGEVGATHITKNIPRCPYERCKGDKEYV